MPIIKSAKKKLKQDRKREVRNLKLKKSLKKAVKKAKLSGVEKDTRAAFKLISKAKKKGIIHKNKAARLKSRFKKNTKS